MTLPRGRHQGCEHDDDAPRKVCEGHQAPGDVVGIPSQYDVGAALETIPVGATRTQKGLRTILATGPGQTMPAPP